MSQKPFKSKLGFEDDDISWLSGSGVPGASSDTDNAGPGSIYSDKTNLLDGFYRKTASGTGTDKWAKISSGGGGGGTATDIIVSTIAGEALSGDVGVVMINNKVYQFDNTNSTHIGNVMGITAGAAVLNAAISVRVYGQVTNGAWAFTTGPIFLSVAGQPTSTAPSSGIIQPIGFSVDIDTMVIQKGLPINT